MTFVGAPRCYSCGLTFEFDVGGDAVCGACAELLVEADVLVPVPLHWTRLFHRRYNQAALLAQSIVGISGVEVAPGLVRCR